MPCDAERELRLLLESHMAQAQQRHAEILQRFSDSFPNGDSHGHREAHEAMIARERADVEFWKKMKYELTSKGLLAFLAWLGWQSWVAFIQGPPK